MKDFSLEDFPFKTFDKLRYADTDRQGHVNNALFSTYLETGRVEILYNSEFPILSENSSFVIASLQIEFLKEIKWPGMIDIGSGIKKIGNSSLVIFQKLFQNGECVSTAETVIVQVDDTTGKSKPLKNDAKTLLQNWLLSE